MTADYESVSLDGSRTELDKVKSTAQRLCQRTATWSDVVSTVCDLRESQRTEAIQRYGDSMIEQPPVQTNQFATIALISPRRDGAI